MIVHHVATVADWRAAQASGSYAGSTYGRTLAQEGFVHASRPDQVEGVLSRCYAGVTEPLVLLTIDTDRLDDLGVPWREDPVGDDTFPHVYAAVPVAAVVGSEPVSPLAP